MHTAMSLEKTREMVRERCAAPRYKREPRDAPTRGYVLRVYLEATVAVVAQRRVICLPMRKMLRKERQRVMSA